MGNERDAKTSLTWEDSRLVGLTAALSGSVCQGHEEEG